MASTTNVILGTGAALLLWSAVGLAVARAVLPHASLFWPLAPALGWAVHSAAALPLFMLIGFNRATASGVALLTLAAAAMALRRGPPVTVGNGVSVPAWAWIGGLILALGPTAAILPKYDDGAVVLAAQIFDHAKVAIIDEMVRLGLPPGNPFFGEQEPPSRLAYYYLLHFSAAEIALITGISGWEADAALTWFSAFASLMLMVGLATWIGGRLAALLVLVVCATGSLRPLLDVIPHVERLILSQSGLGGWLFQAAWVPQHVASASCVVLAMLLLAELARRESLLLIVVFALIVVAGFESSAWVGGVVFAVAALWIGSGLLVQTPPQERLALLGRCAIAAIGAVALAAPFVYDQAMALVTRGGGAPIALQTYAVLGEAFPAALRPFLDMPAFWLVLLVIELPAIYVTGVIAMIRLTGKLDSDRRRTAAVLSHLVGASLMVAWLMVSTIGGNNDLGWRAVLPACLVLTVFAAAGLSHWLRSGHRLAIAGLAAIALALPGGVTTIAYNLTGSRDSAGEAFAATPLLWEAVRRHAGPADRVANNPLFLASMTPWPANISWALLSNRRSCYAGFDLALAFVPLPRQRLRAIDAQFKRVFDGDGWPEDLQELATRYGCRVAVVTALDGAWSRDPFASSRHWRLVETSARGWRIYVAGAVATASVTGPAAPPGGDQARARAAALAERR
ncbi:MAG: hypothetical protein IT536_03770 [Hyphomicrobiales bacterium]|nr:hypothetical protein [Hyphomicrobiales bacterium]